MSGLSLMFQKYKKSKIVIYGLGTETGRVLGEIEGNFNVVGLLDGFRESGELYGYPIIPLEYAVSMGIELIVVVARPGSCKVIAKRIGSVCRENNIALFDVRGKDLLNQPKITYEFINTDGITKKQITDLMVGKDVVSVDLFDTLIMRQTLMPTDVIEIASYRLKENGIDIEDFCRKRLDIEKHLSKNAAPRLIEIYMYMCEQYNISSITPQELCEIEYRIDYSIVVPRHDMCDLMRQLHSEGKKIYIVSDTYYDNAQLVGILDKCGIDFYDGIIASCRYGTGKTSNLFKILKDSINGMSCIHMGDDIVADVECANKHGIETVHIYSGLELLEAVGYFGMWDYMDSLADRIKIGMFVSRLFNSPFQFETEGRAISIGNTYDLGYLLFAPMITDFTIWFKQQVEKYKLNNVWFCARDGYLIKRLYDKLVGNESSTYFLTSRTAAIRAGMKDKADIEYVAGMKFSGTIREQLSERFGINVYSDNDNVFDYADDILVKSARCRKNYMTYIKGLDIDAGEIAFFDFVAKGTTQMYISRMVDNHLKGLYFLQLEPEYMEDKGLDIISFYTNEENDSSAIFDNYYILETILTAPVPSVNEFEFDGKPCYANETRSNEDKICFQSVQEGITDYFDRYLEICPKDVRYVNKKLDEIFLLLIHGFNILDKSFIGLKVEDTFFNRMTNVTDLI
jgi:FMN phosphatase YigB (HAD superfamily)